VSSNDTIERVAWQAYADACLEHDGRHARRAAAEVQQLLPRQAHPSAEGGRTLGL
jgi:hypothetical protein